ncbi:MAG: type IV secretion system DNA-binding domain-containing protein [Patescibacteria group bacterium]
MHTPYDPEKVTYFAETNFRNGQTRFGIKSRDRTRHMYVVGKSGVGKSTLLENMAIQDIQSGEGVAVLDPHGSFAEKMLDYVPEHRIKDVVYFAPFDLEYPVSFNMLEDVGPDKRHFVASGLMSTFKKIWVDAWSARMEYILNNILLALLEYPDATLLGVNRILSDKEFRKKVVANISDPSVKAFWTDEFEKYGERYMQEAGAAIQNKIGQFTANPLVRNIIGQPKSSFDVRDIMDNKKILIVNLSKGRIGEQNTSLLGSMIITKIYIAAMSRADVSHARMADLPNFYFYVDEFQSFANESFADILSEARKYKLALIIAHQYIAQMEEPVRDAVFGNVGTSVAFRVGPLDAELLEKVYAPQFTETDLINLGFAQIYLSLMINDIGSPPFSAKTIPPIPRPAISYRNDVIEWTRANYAKPKDIVEVNIKDWFGRDVQQSEKEKNDFSKPEKKAYVPKDKDAYEKRLSQGPYDAQAIKPSKKEYKSDVEKPKTHTPFKKVFDINTSKETKLELKPGPKPSPELSRLLDTLDTEVPKKNEPKTPFTGEKSLSETIPPVKLAERGPTEQSRNLLKEALLKATQPAPVQGVQPSAPTPPKINPAQVPDNSTKEISHEELQKILE